MVTGSLRALALLACVSMMMAAAGCSSTRALRSGDYGNVAPDDLVKAGESQDSELAPPLRQLLETRLSQGEDAVSEDQAIEAVIALGKVGGRSDSAILLKVLETEPSADVRFFAVDALHAIDAVAFQKAAPRLRESEGSDLVRGRYDQLLAP